MEKKGFTLMELLAVIVILAILTGLAITGYQTYVNSSRNKSFNIAEKSLVTAVREAYADCLTNNPNNDFCELHKELTDKYTYELIYLKELVNDNYMKEVPNPYNTNQLCNTEKSYVYVGSKSDTGINGSDIKYKTCLVCGDHKSNDCLDEELDYSTYATTCSAYYDSVGGMVYDGAWTDRNVYLSFGATGNYRYGIDEFIYIVNGSEKSLDVKKSSNTAILALNSNVASKEYKVYSRDGMSGRGATVSCGNIKIDKGTIDTVNITAKTVSGKTVPNDGWVTEQVVLTANVNPNTSISGYLYQWYFNENKYGEETTSNTLNVQAKGTYKVTVTNRVGKIIKGSGDFSIKVDTKSPICTLVASGTRYNDIYTSDVAITFGTLSDLESNGIEGSGIVTKTIDYPTINSNIKNKVITGTVTDGVGKTSTCSITVTRDTTTPSITAKQETNTITQATNASITDYFNITYGVSSGNTVCKIGSKTVTNVNELALGINTVTCTATGNNGKTTAASTTFRHQYTATGKCSAGTLVNNNTCHFNSDGNICGFYQDCVDKYDECGIGAKDECTQWTDKCTSWQCTLSKYDYTICKCSYPDGSCMTYDSGHITSDAQKTNFERDCSNIKTCHGSGSLSCIEYTKPYTATGSACNNAKTRVCTKTEKECTKREDTCQRVKTGETCTDKPNSCDRTQYLSYSCPTSGKNGNTGATITPTPNGSTCSF